MLLNIYALYCIHHDEVKRKLLYLSLSGDARIWFKCLNDKCRLDWECLRKFFYLTYYTPKEAYDDRYHINIFWTRVGESIAQPWGRLMISSVRIFVMVILIVLY
jgi:hypothetical protein